MTAFAVLGIYVSFQAVVLAALRQRLMGWRPAGLWNLGSAGFVVNVLALAYGLFAIVLLIKPAPGTETFLDRWIVAIGLVVVARQRACSTCSSPGRTGIPRTSPRATPARWPTAPADPGSDSTGGRAQASEEIR